MKWELGQIQFFFLSFPFYRALLIEIAHQDPSFFTNTIIISLSAPRSFNDISFYSLFFLHIIIRRVWRRRKILSVADRDYTWCEFLFFRRWNSSIGARRQHPFSTGNGSRSDESSSARSIVKSTNSDGTFKIAQSFSIYPSSFFNFIYGWKAARIDTPPLKMDIDFF